MCGAISILLFIVEGLATTTWSVDSRLNTALLLYFLIIHTETKIIDVKLKLCSKRKPRQTTSAFRLSARERPAQRSSHCLVGTCSQHSRSIYQSSGKSVSECKEVKFSGGGSCPPAPTLGTALEYFGQGAVGFCSLSRLFFGHFSSPTNILLT